MFPFGQPIGVKRLHIILEWGPSVCLGRYLINYLTSFSQTLHISYFLSAVKFSEHLNLKWLTYCHFCSHKVTKYLEKQILKNRICPGCAAQICPNLLVTFLPCLKLTYHHFFLTQKPTNKTLIYFTDAFTIILPEMQWNLIMLKLKMANVSPFLFI